MDSDDDIARAYVMAAKLAVQDLMRREGLSRSAVADIVNTSPATVSRWLADGEPQFFDLYHYVRLCRHLRIPPAALLPPADWTGEGYQASLKYAIKLPERDLAFVLAVHRLVMETYPPAMPSKKKKAPDGA
ncbi:XRE family transcriptional regulator [Aeromonas schubertii]|uniref:XRE family transcriptional regulator n=1 Tax=Aeromonas schubertii TaxID=652 RepID=A0ABS7V5M8_9GAMM|nr:helix-turn-helix transcriptional regulator [Aeromonas schubertii]MBZ6064689.1 XRE family transcriptional regulator [Aeromonas schubertii]